MIIRVGLFLTLIKLQIIVIQEVFKEKSLFDLLVVQRKQFKAFSIS